jgi:subtilisin family serine protease
MEEHRPPSCGGLLLALTALGFAVASLPLAQAHAVHVPSQAGARRQSDVHPYREAELLVRFHHDATSVAVGSAHGRVRATVAQRFDSIPGLQLVRLPAGTAVDEAMRSYRALGAVRYAEPNYVVTALAVPNDPLFGQLWGLHNTGQAGGKADEDIDAPEAWNLATGSSNVVVAILDTGLDYEHVDLAANVFINAADCNGDGVDDDGNGYVDDCYGIDFFNEDSDPWDDNGHGTHVAGTIGATGNNGIGVTGVNWSVRLLPCKFLDYFGRGFVSDAIRCLDYVKAMKDRGENVIATNNSWGGPAFSQALQDAIDAQLDSGILFVAAAGNDASDIDGGPFFPASYDLPNVISVAATTRSGSLAPFSNYGQRSVHLGAPGHEILSTTPHDTYTVLSGTSMAAPHVSGVAALLKAADPSRDWRAIRNLLLTGGDNTPALAKTLTGKALNAHGSLACSGATVKGRVRPAGNLSNTIAVPFGQAVALAMTHATCGAAATAGQFAVTVRPGGEVVSLSDDGLGVDRAADDGIYTGAWIPPAMGIFTLVFPDDDILTVHVAVVLESPGPTAGEFGAQVVMLGSNVLVGAPNYGTIPPHSGAVHLFDGTSGTLLHTFHSPTAQPNDEFGRALGVAGTKLAVGAPGADGGVGAVYLFDADLQSPGFGTLLQTFSNPSPQLLPDHFGLAVATLGDDVLVGAPGVAGKRGHAYLFETATGNVLRTFSSSFDGYDDFGHAVSGAGSRALVAAPLDYTLAPQGGAAHLFDAGTGALLVTLRPNGLTNRLFGISVGTLGETFLIAAPHESYGGTTSQGAVYQIDGITGGLIRKLRRPPSPPAADIAVRFGFAVAAAGRALVAGAPFDHPSGSTIHQDGMAYVIDAATGGALARLPHPRPEPIHLGGSFLLSPRFGIAVAAEGKRIAVGSPHNMDRGEAYVFSLPSTPAALGDFFRCYSARTMAGTPVRQTATLVDAFETRIVTVSTPLEICNPVDPDGDEAPAATPGLACYRIRSRAGKLRPARIITAYNEFGHQRLIVDEVQALCVPTTPAPPKVNHFKCYRAKPPKGAPKFVARSALLTDPFETKVSLLLKPTAFCTTVDVNGQGTPSPAIHLTCFQTKYLPKQPPFGAQAVQVTNQFGDLTLLAKRPQTLCVPSEMD